MSIEELQTYCLHFKGVSQDIKWGTDLCYSIGNKMFCVLDTAHNNAAAFKTNHEDFINLIEREGIIPAPYMARYQWVLVERNDALKKIEWKEYIQKSYDLVFNKLPLTEKLKLK